MLTLAGWTENFSLFINLKQKQIIFHVFMQERIRFCVLSEWLAIKVDPPDYFQQYLVNLTIIPWTLGMRW